MSTKGVLTAAERAIMETTFKASMLRAADIIDRITEDDVTEQQARLLGHGCTLEQVSRLDRATIAAAHLRAIANGELKRETGIE